MMLKAYCSNIYSIIKRQIWLTALWFAALFFALPVQTALTLQSQRPRYYMFGDFQAQAAQDLLNIFGAFGRQSALLACLLMAMAFMSALVFGAYMHKQKQVDFYHSQPISRTRLLLQNAAAGLLALFIPYLLNLLLTVVVALAMGAGAAFPWGAFWGGLAVHTLYFTAIFATALIAVVISGKTAVAGISGAFMLAALPALLGLALAAAYEFYPTFYSSLYDWNLILRWLSPAAAYMLLSANGLPNGILPILAYDALALTAAVLLYRRRGSEAAGQAIAFKAARPVLKYAMACLVASVFAAVFHGIGNYCSGSYFWLYFGIITGGFLATQITEIVYAFDFRAVLRNLRGLAIFLVIYVALITCVINDVSGFNIAVPRADQVASAQIFLPGANNYLRSSYGVSYGRSGYFTDEEIKSLERGEFDNLALGPVTQPQAIAAAVNIAARYANSHLPPGQQQPQASEAQQARWRQQGKQYLLDSLDETNGVYLNRTDCRVVFTLKNGRTMARSYNANIPVQYLLDDIAAIYGQEDFRNAQLRELMFADERYVPEQLELFELYSALPPLDWLTAEDRANLLAALRADLLELTVEQQQQAMPLGILRMRMYGGAVDYPVNGDWLNTNGRPYMTQIWPIYGCCSRTLAFLEQAGIGPELWQPQLADIRSISLVSRYTDYNSKDYYTQEKYAYSQYAVDMPQPVYGSYGDNVIIQKFITDEKTDRNNITDAAKIVEIIGQSYPAQARDYNCFIDIDDSTEVEVRYEGQGGQIYTLWRVFGY